MFYRSAEYVLIKFIIRADSFNDEPIYFARIIFRPLSAAEGRAGTAFCNKYTG
jgi:hypothetical protein